LRDRTVMVWWPTAKGCRAAGRGGWGEIQRKGVGAPFTTVEVEPEGLLSREGEGEREPKSEKSSL
jgi:hypothetical protein